MDTNERDRLEKAIARMGEPSWWILEVLSSMKAMPGIEILQEVEEWLERAGYPTRRLDPSTLHYALKRMEEDGLVAADGYQEVDVPGPRGSTRREPRRVYRLKGLGSQALQLRQRLWKTSPHLTLSPRPIWEYSS